MSMKRIISRNLIINLLIIIILLVILFMPKLSMEAAKRGLLLWFNVIIPTLFPFILLSNIIVNSNIINYINYLFTPIMSKFFGLPGVSGYAFVIGLLSGYPVGGKITSDLLEKKAITQSQAQYMMTFCNNASPMFIIGFIATGLLDNSYVGIIMLIIIYFANFITALIYRVIYSNELPVVHNSKNSMVYKSKRINFSLFDDCIMNAISLIVKIGGYIIFFSIILSLLSILPMDNNILKKFLLSCIELSNGVKLLADDNSTFIVKFVLLCTVTSFGTFSVHAQTASVLSGTNINLYKYMFSKAINAVITFITALLVVLYI